MAHKKAVWLWLVLVLFTLACSSSQIFLPTATPPVDRPATLIAQSAADSQAMQKTALIAEITSKAMQTADVRATQDVLATHKAQVTLDTNATATQRALNLHATQTYFFNKKQTSTAEAEVLGTQLALPLLEWAQKLFDEGITDIVDGRYYRIDDFDQSIAEIGRAVYWRTGYEAENFLLSTHVALSSGSDNANWFESSCGIIFGEEDQLSYDYVDISMDGYIYMYNCRGGSCIRMAMQSYGSPMIPQGEIDILLMVFKEHIHVYVNGQELISAADLRYIKGHIAYLLSTGTNKDFGTRCQMTHAGLWIYP